MVVRVQCLSGAVRSMLKVAVCLVVAAVTVMALSGLAGTTAEAQTHPASSCQPDTLGNDPCDGATGPIGENSCNGDDACVDSSGQIGDGSCIGYWACFRVQVPIGDGSCNGSYACDRVQVPIGDGSCNGSYACDGEDVPIGDGSCNGDHACDNLEIGPIGDGSCNGEDACYNATTVGDGSCIGFNACNDTSDVAIGEGSCIGLSACAGSSGSIGAGSCIGLSACPGSSGSIGAGSCIGEKACYESSSDIGGCEFNFVYVDRDCDGLASDVDCDDNDALNVSRCAPRLPYPEIVNAPANADVGAWVLPNPTAGTDTAAAAPLSEVLPLSEAPELAFTGTTSTVAATFAFALLGLGFLTLGEQRRRQDS